jgi:hypothetical protein
MVGGTPTSVDDFSLIGLMLIFAFSKNKLHLKFSHLFLMLLLIIIYLSNMMQKGTYEFEGLLVLCSLITITVIVTQLCKHDVLIERVHSRYSKIQILLAWICIIIYIGFYNIILPGRVVSPGVLLMTFGVTDAHLFAAQVATLSLVCFYQSGKLRLVILVISFVALISIGSRSGPYLFFIGVLVSLTKNRSKANLKFLMFMVPILAVSLYLNGLLDPIQMTNQIRSFSFGGASDQHRFQILERATQSLTFLDIFVGDANAFRGGTKYYDNFLITLLLLTGVVGAVIFCAITLIPLADRRAYGLIIILVSLFPLSEFLLIPRFQILMYLLIAVYLYEGHFRHVRQNN